MNMPTVIQAVLALAAISGSIAAQVPEAVTEFRLLTATRGWFLKGSHLFASDLLGKERSDITPLLATGQDIAAVFFLDPLHGWVVLNKMSDWPPELSVSRTTDGGQNWTDSPFKFTDKALLEAYGGPARIVFMDESHGWMALQYTSSSAMTIGALFRTSDAGETWTQLPRPPIFGETGFWNETSGWVTGGPIGDQLHITHDGGKHWTKQSISRPAAVQEATQTFFGRPSFSPDGHGIVPVTYSLRDDTAVLVTYTNSGQRPDWKVVKVEPNMPGWAATDILEGRLVRSVKRPQGIDTGDGTTHAMAALPGGVPDQGGVNAISFSDEKHGWFLYHGAQCAAGFRNCVNMEVLLATEDGGATVSAIDIANSQPYTPRAGWR